LRRARASSAERIPAARSASIAICLPGKASSVKRADTSETRPAPLVTTIMLMIIRIANTNSPTTKLPPIRNAPKASITWPAAAPPRCPLTSTTRVEATLSDSRSKVANSSTVGNAEKSSGFSAFIAAISTATDSAMLSTKNTSSTAAGSGTTISMIRIRMPNGAASDAGLSILLNIA
jgi:hypothetical protein